MKNWWIILLLALVFFILFTKTGYSLALEITSSFLDTVTHVADNIH